MRVDVGVVLGAVVGLAGAVVGAVAAYVLQDRADRRRRADVAIHHALAAATEYQNDLLGYGMELVGFGKLPEPTDEDDPEAARQFGFQVQYDRLRAAESQLLDTERRLVRAGVDLALLTDLHRTHKDTVTGFDIIMEGLGSGEGSFRLGLANAKTHDEALTVVFKYGVILQMFEDEAIAYRDRKLKSRGRRPEPLPHPGPGSEILAQQASAGGDDADQGEPGPQLRDRP